MPVNITFCRKTLTESSRIIQRPGQADKADQGAVPVNGYGGKQGGDLHERAVAGDFPVSFFPGHDDFRAMAVIIRQVNHPGVPNGIPHQAAVGRDDRDPFP